MRGNLMNDTRTGCSVTGKYIGIVENMITVFEPQGERVDIGDRCQSYCDGFLCSYVDPKSFGNIDPFYLVKSKASALVLPQIAVPYEANFFFSFPFLPLPPL